MKKKIKKVITGASILIGIILILFIGYGIKAQYEIKTMNPLETQMFSDNIYVIRDSFVNMYFFKDGAEYIAIDAGNDVGNIKAGMEKLNIKPEKIKAILLTHSDSDHTAALSIFKSADLYLSRQEEQLITGKTSRFLFFGNDKITKNYSLLKDQEEITIGDTKIKCFLIPGHTPGSMSFLINNKYLFVGDAMGIKDNSITPFNSFFNMDNEQAIKSMTIIKNIDEAEIIFSAHHGSLIVSKLF